MASVEQDHSAVAQTESDTSPREEIVFGREVEWDKHLDDGGIRRIGPLGPMDSGIAPSTARQLIEAGYMEPTGQQNRGPEMDTFVAFGEMIADMAPEVDVEFRGYMISPYRPDERIRLTSIHIDAADEQELPSSVKDLFVARFGGRCIGEPYCPPDNYETNSDHYTAYWD